MSRLILVGGLSGVGKDTICGVLRNEAFWRKLIAVTTRPPREGERDGFHYRFRTQEQFRADDQAGLLAERTVYIGSGLAYGIYRSDVEAARDSGWTHFCLVDANAKHQLLPFWPDIVSVHLIARPEVLRQRMGGRGDTPEQIDRRLARYSEEVGQGAAAFDCQVDISDLNLGDSVELVRLLAQTLRPRG